MLHSDLMFIKNIFVVQMMQESKDDFTQEK